MGSFILSGRRPTGNRFHTAQALGIHFVLALALLSLLVSANCSATIQDVIFGDGFDGFDLTTCDAGLTSDSSDAAQYAAAIDLCKTTTEQAAGWGLISATLTLPPGTGTPEPISRRIQTTFGSGITPRAGAAMAVLSSGVAVDAGAPLFFPFQPGLIAGSVSTAPADWLAAHGGVFPVAPGCPPAGSVAAIDAVMLTLRIRVPGNARSFSVAANFLGADYPENVCGPYNDLFVALLDSGFAGAPANPADKNLATYTAANLDLYPVGVNLARTNPGLFTQCVNGATGCLYGSSGSTSTCTATSGLTGTGMDTPAIDEDVCGASNGVVGGGTDWLVLRGNVVPGEIIQLRFAIWDTGDPYYDSLVTLDKFRWSHVVTTPGATRN